MTRYSPSAKIRAAYVWKASFPIYGGRNRTCAVAEQQPSRMKASRPCKRGGVKPPLLHGRDDKIRTCGLCVPNAALYQTEPHLVLHFLIIASRRRFVKGKRKKDFGWERGKKVPPKGIAEKRKKGGGGKKKFFQGACYFDGNMVE